MSIQPYQKYYQQIINDPSVHTFLQSYIQDYNQSGHPAQSQIFPICTDKDTPEFFKTNLLSPNRIIKYLNGDYCVYRAFYFQLFKLMFQIQNEEKDYLQLFKQIVFDPNIVHRNGQNSRARRQNSRVKGNGSQRDIESSRLSEMSQAQAFKREFEMHQKCIGQFTQKVLQNRQQFTSFEQYLPYYPQIDESMVIILETFIENAANNKSHQNNQSYQMDSIQSILQYLCEIFEIQLVVIENCFKFEESDVFLYVEEKEDDVWVYIAFNEIGEEDEEEDGVGEEREGEREEEREGKRERVRKERGRYENVEGHNNQNQQTKMSSSTNQPQYHYQPKPQPQISSQDKNSHQSFQNPSKSQRNSQKSLNHSHKPQSNSYKSQRNSQKGNSYKSQRNSQKSLKQHVITSEHKPQQKYDHYFNPKQQQSNHLHNYTHNSKLKLEDNRSHRTSSDMIPAKTSHEYQQEVERSSLTKSNYLPTRNSQNQNFQNSKNSHNLPYDFTYKSSSYISSQYPDKDTYKMENTNEKNFASDQNQFSQSKSSHLLPSALSQSNIENLKKQSRNFQKKVRYFDEDYIIEENLPSNRELNKMESLTESYKQDNFHKQPEKDQGSYIHKTPQQSSLHAIQNSAMQRTSERKLTDSKSQTIINMFGDMLSSCANINAFDGIQGSSSSIANGFRGNPQMKMQAEQDRNSGQKDSYSQNDYINQYGGSNNIIQNNQRQVVSKNVSMKKVRSEQVIFEAKPKEELSRRVSIKQTSIEESENLSKSGLKGQTSKKNGFGHDDVGLIDSQELRNNNDGHFETESQREHGETNSNKNSSKSIKSQSSHSQQHQAQKYSPVVKNKNKQYIQNIEARSSSRGQLNSPKQKSSQGSFNKSSKDSISKSNHELQNIPVEEPFIKVNTLKSQSQTSSKQMDKRNNYYQDDDFSQVTRGEVINKQQNTHSRKTFAPQYKSLEYVASPAAIYQNTSSNDHYPSSKVHLARTYTYNQEQVNSTSNKQPILNTQQQDDFFFHPSHKSSLKYGLKTIQQVRASKQTFKDSYQPSQITIKDRNSKDFKSNQSGSMEDKLHKYELVNSITGGFTQSPKEQQRKYNIDTHNQQYKGGSSFNRLLDTNTFKFKETKYENKELNDDSVNNGTFYKQFTNSKVLKLLKQPYKTKVQILKNRFKGEHRSAISKVII